MKKLTRNIVITVIISAMLISVVCGMIFYSNQPRQYLAETYGIQIPSRIKIESLHNESGWDSRLSYGTLIVQKDNHDGLVNTLNFIPLSETEDSRVLTLIKDVNDTFSISKVSATSRDISYQKITIKGDSLMIIFYNAKSQEYGFYAARYTNR